MKKDHVRQPQEMTILRRRDVEKKVGIGRSTIYDWLNPESPRFDPQFPRPIRLGHASVGWIEHEITEYVRILIERSRGKAS